MVVLPRRWTERAPLQLRQNSTRLLAYYKMVAATITPHLASVISFVCLFLRLYAQCGLCSAFSITEFRCGRAAILSWIPSSVWNFLYLRISKVTVTAFHPAWYPMGIKAFSRVLDGRGFKVTTNLILLQGLRMYGAVIPLLITPLLLIT